MVLYSEVTGFDLLLRVVLLVFGSYFFFEHFFTVAFDRFKKINCVESKKKYNGRVVFIISFFVILLSWVLAWISEFPGIIPGDTLAQLYQALGIRAMNALNPLIHTLIIRWLYCFFNQFFNDVNKTIFCLGFIQMLVNAAIYAYVVSYVYCRSNNPILMLASLGFYAFVSYNVFYNITISKDSAYAAFLTLFIVELDRCYYYSKNKYVFIIPVLVGVLFALLRNNGFYSLIVLFGLTIFFVFFRKSLKKTLILLLVILSLSGVIKMGAYGRLISYYNSNNPNLETKTSSNNDNKKNKYVFNGNFLYVIPFQQVANVVAKGRELNEKEEWLIEEYMPLEAVKDVYDPILVDPIFSYISNHVKPTRGDIKDIEYVKLWIELFLKYPIDYIEAYVNMNRYYYYPNRYVNTYYIGIPDNNLGIKKQDLISKEKTMNIREIYAKQKDLPFVGTIMSPGVITFVMIIIMFYLLNSKDYVSFIHLCPVAINFLILMLFVPLNDEFRYIYPVVASLPLMISFIYKGGAQTYDA